MDKVYRCPKHGEIKLSDILDVHKPVMKAICAICYCELLLAKCGHVTEEDAPNAE